ncbi:O-antigen ligase family protein [Lawsonibacter sp. JLR.KK007]|jgi:O-antigen ligase|uniref:O-antigen ligase family protein n=1 Tax=Lawsonibacter sp. JLR.KK007 TaxID=3114293 RepID=UPI002FF1ECAA
MERAKDILNGSWLWRALMALCAWCGGQWENSTVVQWFLHPRGWNRGASESSVFYRLWSWVRWALCRIYEALRLDKLFAGSVFTRTWFWCMMPVVLAPIFPTMAVLGMAAVGYCSLLLGLVRDKNRPLAWAPINRYVILYAAVYLAGTMFSVNLDTSLEPGLLSVAFILFTVVLYNAVTNRSQLDTLLAFMVTAAAAVSVYGILQYFFRWGYQSAAWVDSDMFSSISFRVASTLGNPNMLGQYLILMIPIGGAKLLSAKDWFSRVFYFGCCGVMCACMLLTFSRGAWLGLLFAGAAFVVLLNPRLMLLIPVALTALWFVLPDTVINRFASIGNLSDASTSYRVYIWMGTLAMLKNYWLCGIGPGPDAFNMVYPAYSYNGISAPHSHNLFLQIVCDAGIAALAVFVILLFVYFRMMCIAIGKEHDWSSRVHQIAFTSGVFGFMVQAMTDYSFYNYRVLFLFWTYLALGALCTRRRRLPEGRLLA